MPCPTCDHTMSHIGETQDGPTRRAIWHCQRCGTLRVDGFGAFDAVPKLVERCREFATDHYMHPTTLLGDKWRRLGIAESIHPPEGRPEHTEEEKNGGMD